MIVWWSGWSWKWLFDEVVDHIGIYGSQGTEGLLLTSEQLYDSHKASEWTRNNLYKSTHDCTTPQLYKGNVSQHTKTVFVPSEKQHNLVKPSSPCCYQYRFQGNERFIHFGSPLMANIIHLCIFVFGSLVPFLLYHTHLCDSKDVPI